MKKSRFFTIILVIMLVSCLSLGLIACLPKDGGDNGGGDTPAGHSHSWSDTYSMDDTHHWYACSGCDEKKGYEEHVFEADSTPDPEPEPEPEPELVSNRSTSSDICKICGFDKSTSNTYKTITFDVNGGNKEIQPMRFAAGQVMSNLPTPRRSGYNFVGWVDKYTLTKYDFTSIMPNENLTLVAQWEVILTSYDDNYVSFKPAKQGYKSNEIYYQYNNKVDKFVYVEITSDNLKGNPGAENNFNLTTMSGMEYKVKPGYTWAWYQGSFNNPNGAQRFTLDYGSNVQFITISDSSGVVQCTYLLDIYVRHDYYIYLYSDIYATEPYDKVRVIENDKFSADTKTLDIGFEFDSRVYYNSNKDTYEKFEYNTTITKSWNLYQTYKDVEITADLDGGSLSEKLIVTPYTKYFTLPSPEKEGYDFLGWQMPNGKYLTNIQGYSGEKYISTDVNPESLTAIYAEKQYYYEFDGIKLITKGTVPVATYTDSTMDEILDIVYTPYGYSCSVPVITPNSNNFVFKKWQQYYFGSDNKFGETLSTFDFSTQITEPLALIPEMEYTQTPTIPIGTGVTFDNKNTFKMYLPVAQRYVLNITTTDKVSFTINSYGNTPTKDYVATATEPQSIALDYYVYNYGENVYSTGYVTFTINSLYGTFTAELVGTTASGAENSVQTNTNLAKVGEEFSCVFNEAGYVFNGWYDGDTKLTDELAGTFTMTADEKEYVAKCEKITISTSDENCSSVNSVDNIYKPNDEIQLSTEQLALGYVFKGWFNNGILISNELTCNVSLKESGNTFLAKWEADSNLTCLNFTSTKTTLEILGVKDKTISNIILPDYVTSIKYGAFSGCSRLTSITLPFVGGNQTENTYLGYIFGASSSDYNSRYVPSSLKEVIISDKATSISSSAFSGCTSLTSITIPDSITSIGKYAFNKCNGLTSITIPDSVTNIGSGAFSGCWNLRSITLPFVGGSPSHNTYLGYIFGASSYKDNSNYVPTSLKEVIITDNATSISDYAFYRCSGLTSINIPNSITSIGYQAFSDCSSLTSITIPDSVTSIGGDAFSGCSSLTAVYITDLAAWCKIRFSDYKSNPLSCANNLYLNGELVTDLIIPDSVTAIRNYAFDSCSGLTSITIPNSVTSIGEDAFSDCSSLSAVYITDLAAWCNINFSYVNSNPLYSNPLYYAHNLYLNGELVTDLVIPDSVTSIGRSAFSGCSSLTSITIPDSVTSIGQYAFDGCSSLTSITIPDSVTSIGGDAFSGCSSLTSITIPDSVTSIGWNAFSYCRSLTSVTIGNKVTSIGNSAFRNCSSLTGIIFSGTKAEWTAISKGSNWNYNTGNYVVTCTDGKLDKSGNVIA